MSNAWPVCISGDIVHCDEKLFTAGSRLVKFGDGFFETMRLSNGRLAFFDDHHIRIQKAFNILGFSNAAMYSKEFIHRQVSRLADACGKPVSARVRITFFRKGEGMIHPVSNDADFFIEMSELAAQYFYSTEGISLVLLNEPLKCTGLLANIKSCNALPQVIASVYRDAQGADDCLLLNSHYRICETISSNIFLLQGISAYTPPITEGCVQGVMRQHVMRLLRELSFNIAEEKLEVRDLHTAETVLLTNVIQGINWVREFEGKRYDSGNCAELVRHLNNRLEA